MRTAERPGVRAGTYCGNPLATAAVTATLEVLRVADYHALLAQGDRLRAGLVDAFDRAGRVVSTSGCGTVFTLWFSPHAPTNYAEAAEVADHAMSLRWHMALRRRGLLTMPFPFGRFYLSFAHDEAVIDEMTAIIGDAAEEIQTHS
jgi:glutamate-1-semialdehyde 2,1-aminomutase